MHVASASLRVCVCVHVVVWFEVGPRLNRLLPTDDDDYH